ncbi:MAG: tRNA (N(6)-L-threonylcarbamoyladenosine(37)-C(2))-methylthiotransferase MtaB [Erysipelotrichaceae bacterium]|nr:tRNA (N(6)-L-threonylcarbamoyladenosine(37)-C(2))-methylthiotransferase MtaB [Erysipelotrichaceae bacterium]
MKFAICNLGCKVNNYESNWYREQLQQKYEEVEFGRKADIYVINTCTVTNTAGSKSRQMIHRARKLNPDALIVAVGCYVQMEFSQPDIFEDCDIIIGSKDKTKLPELIEEYLEKKERISLVEDFETCAFEKMLLKDFNQTRAYLKIQDGCNQFCGYCTIPLARGRERSLDAQSAVQQAESLVKAGHKEIVLTGIHTGRYQDGNINLTKLIKMILSQVPELERIRISSIEMTEVTDELIDLIALDKRIARHLHIPLQVGNDRLLKLNNRPYTTGQFAERIRHIRERIPLISISSDIIAGLPTETDEEFRETYEFCRDVSFSFMHVFPYALKKKTKDAMIREQVPADVKKQRAADLTTLSKELYNVFVMDFLGKECDVLFERSVDGLLTGHNSEYVTVTAKGDESHLHCCCRVRVTGAKDGILEGEITA